MTATSVEDHRLSYDQVRHPSWCDPNFCDLIGNGREVGHAIEALTYDDATHAEVDILLHQVDHLDDDLTPTGQPLIELTLNSRDPAGTRKGYAFANFTPAEIRELADRLLAVVRLAESGAVR